MKIVKLLIFTFYALSCNTAAQKQSLTIIEQAKIEYYTVDLQKQSLRFYSHQENGQPFVNIGNLKRSLEKRG